MVETDFAQWVLEKVLEKGVEQAVVRLQERVYESITYDTGVLRSYSVSRVVGLGIRAITKGGTGYAYTSSLDRNSVVRAIDRAVTLSKVASEFGKKSIASVSPVRDRFRVEFKVDPHQVDPKIKVDLVKEVNTNSMKRESIVSAITRLGLERDRRIILASEGTEIEVDVVGVGFAHMAVAKYGAVIERVSDRESFIGGYEYIEKRDWGVFAEEVDKLAVKASQAKTPPPGTYVAVVDNEVVGLLLHEAFGHASEGDGVVAGASILKGRIGEKVASELVTIVDAGVIEGGYPVPYDDEGVPKGKTVIVDRGVLKGYLTSRDTSKELDLEPTGNARAQDISFDTLVRQTNYYAEPRDRKVDELFEGITYGIYLKGRGAMGGQVNPSVGTYTFSIGPSYIIRNGEPSELVRGVVVSGNILETLKEVDAVANDLKITTSVFGGCGKGGQMVRVGDGGPHIRTRKIVVGGG
ncbi:MAG: TldD/PmbA family protein [Sulfolobales archaeon]|nr:TldD/PmbA family protein [Sulfolobales archaeon]MDW8083171.1 TldD/PmbA family protein [Sulfolobales archaeon]